MNKQILRKDGHFFKNNKDEDGNSGMNYEDIKKGKIYENYKKTIEQLNKGTLFRNTENKKRYYDDINE